MERWVILRLVKGAVAQTVQAETFSFCCQRAPSLSVISYQRTPPTKRFKAVRRSALAHVAPSQLLQNICFLSGGGETNRPIVTAVSVLVWRSFWLLGQVGIIQGG